MLRFLSGLHLDRNSFWIGFLAGSLFLWLLSRLRPFLPELVERLRARLNTAREGITVNPEERYRRDVLRQAQRAHLASVYFSLDEVLVPPRLLAPPPPVEPGVELHESLIFNEVLPYLPDCPELGSYYQSPKLSLPDALSGGANLVLLGRAGMGKTVALAQLASMLARQDEAVGSLGGLTPYLVQAADFIPVQRDQPALEAVIEVVASNVSALTLPRLPNFIRSTFSEGQALLLLDGLDELPGDSFDQLVDLVERLLEDHPQLRVVAAASPEYVGGLPRLGFLIIPMAAWDDQERLDFINKWSNLWNSYIARQGDRGRVNPLLLNNWLAGCEPSLTPLELTLHVWASYAGDVLGDSSSDAIEAYLRRMSAPNPKARPVLEKLAAQMTLTANPVLTYKEAEKWVPSENGGPSTLEEELPAPGQARVEPGAKIPAEGDPADEAAPAANSESQGEVEGAISENGKGKPAAKPVTASQRMLDDLVAAGLLVNRRNSRLGFVHPVLAGYLAGAALAGSGGYENLAQQPDWSGKSLALCYLSSRADISSLLRSTLESSDDPLSRPLFIAAGWLREAPPRAAWRQYVLRRLSNILQQEALPMGMRVRALVALAFSGDPGVLVLFRQYMEHASDSMRELGALGCGLLQDVKAVKSLSQLLDDAVIEVRLAAILALSRIGNKPAMEAIAATLLSGKEEMRRAAAEALAMQPEEGYPALEEGSSMQDLLVRRAVVYGLARVDEPWARQRLDKLQIEDEQWVVRSAAIQVLEELSRPNARVPRPHPELAQTPWLIEFAGKLGIGIAPGKPALDLVTQAVKTGDYEQRLAALHYLGRFGGEGSLHAIYPLFYSDDPEQAEAAYQALWMLSASGVGLAEPQQFGLG